MGRVSAQHPSPLTLDPSPVITPKRVLIIGPSNIGDAILTTDVILAVRRRFPEAHLALVVGERATPLFVGDPRIQTLMDTAAFDTPLGRVTVDAAAAQAIAHLPQVTISPQAHAQEHSLEVHLPFLQSILTDFKLLPLAVGMATPEEVAEVLETLWGGEETLIVVSSDLSHYLPYAAALSTDRQTMQDILHLRQPIDHEQACGGTPINGLILCARHRHLTPHLLDLRNSGDTAGPHDQVVGYAALAFTEGEQHDQQ